MCKYWHMQLPEYFKRHDSSGETLVQPMGNSRLQKCFIPIQSFVYIDMIRLFPVKVRVKKSSDVNWIWQAKNMELTCICAICWLCTLSVFIFCKSSPCKRKTHCVNEWKKVVRVCARARTYIDMIFWKNIVQAANIFSIPNAGYFKRNFEFNVPLFESGLDRVWGNWIKLFWKFKNSNLALISWLNAAFGNFNAN